MHSSVAGIIIYVASETVKAFSTFKYCNAHLSLGFFKGYVLKRETRMGLMLIGKLTICASGLKNLYEF